MANEPQRNGSPNDDGSGTPLSPETDAATEQPLFRVNARNRALQRDFEIECFWKILHDEDAEEFFRVARQYVNPLA